MAKKKTNVTVKGFVNIGGIIKKKPPQSEFDKYKIAIVNSSLTVR